MTQKIRSLTGITTTGTPHLGNYVGAIRPALMASRRAEVESFYFLADYHALIKCEDPQRIARSRMEIAATWLAVGLDTDRAFFYRQSDIPEIPELTWLLTCVAAKGMLNRAHAYKAAVDDNVAAGNDPDAGIGAGLYMYPVLMAADILVFNASHVPVGRDQIQHIEMTRDIAQRFNHLYGAAWAKASGAAAGELPFTLPQAQVEDTVATLPGTDGRKMSKSYDNAIALWLPEKELRRAIDGIVTDSRAPGEPKDADNSNLFDIYQAFASAAQTSAMRQAFADGIAWGEAKRALFEVVDAELAGPRERYTELMQRPDDIEDILRAGARRARERAAPFLDSLRDAVGLGHAPAAAESVSVQVPPPPVVIVPSFKTWREADGRFYFRLVDGEDNTLLHSCGHAGGREAGENMTRLRDDETAFAPQPHAEHAFALHGGDGEMIAYGLVDAAQVADALVLLRRARQEKAQTQE